MSLMLVAAFAAVVLFAGMLGFFELGRRIGLARVARDPEGMAKGAGPVEAAVFGLLGLLLAFAFSGAASRFEDRRHLITAETNAIGTAYFRLDLLPGDTQEELRDLFRRYLDTRIETYRNVSDAKLHEALLARGVALQGEIWGRALSAARRPEAPPHAPMLVVPALNEMIDIATTRAVASLNHPPKVIYLLLGSLSLVSAMLVGYVTCAAKGRSWFYPLLFATTMSLTFYVILDLEFPRLGLIRIDSADRIMIELSESMR